MTKNKEQHFVPAFYLYNFTNDQQRSASKHLEKRKTKIHHYDFSRHCLKERPIEKVATESYNFSSMNADGSYNHSLDNDVQRVESIAAKAIEELKDISSYALRIELNLLKCPILL